MERLPKRGPRVVRLRCSQATDRTGTCVPSLWPGGKFTTTLLEVKKEFAGLVDIQLVAFPQDGIFARDGDEGQLENALRLGVDCVGGIPHYEPTSELGLKEVHRVFELAKQYSRRIDVHCDETDDPSSRFLEVMADDTVKFGLGGRVTASHCGVCQKV